MEWSLFYRYITDIETFFGISHESWQDREIIIEPIMALKKGILIISAQVFHYDRYGKSLPCKLIVRLTKISFLGNSFYLLKSKK